MQTLPTLAPGSSRVAVIGAGPAGLMAAEVLAAHGVAVDVYDAMPSAGRKFLLAGRGGMNITHSEAQPDFLPRYGKRREQVAPFVRRFDGEQLRAWIHELGIETFVGSSGRVFPREMKAAPLLRAWLHRLRQAGVQFHMRHRWLGWQEDGALRLAHPEGEIAVRPDAVVLALGGGSWPRLGSDGSWVPLLQARQVEVAPLLPSNCGFELDWSAHFRERFAGEPVKPVVASTAQASGGVQNRRGEFIVTAEGIEGSLVYAMSAALRDTIAAEGSARLYLDLLPDWPLEKVEAELAHPRGARSLSSHLQSRLHLKGVKAGLLRELLSKEDFADMGKLARAIKALPLTVWRTRPLAEAISSAGGVSFEALDDALMLRALPGVFCAGEMLDWEAPTGGYLLTACFATGRAAAAGVLHWLISADRAAGLSASHEEQHK
ncbi:TIGR03862 family flavoprotein [Herbaspirillum rubrisubalbicans]|uniref:NAD(FAD)-utilizing dehydrogenase n=2 Tax=Herbaspirillum rubrisubalbicans TaxID=80842 RepID=A0ABX9BZQ7_9BURK|nr:TIGR03862 family flavoprotein [Herbaspirillum rubrisubalbicans]QJQ03299.1 aminoacetone oxidase family FAD-binding enzyme [Herbaspirillum rubrisubalbicans Os34]RAM63530.1 NAD(FAD)-utilizing dehydrogenase [Herbaspirillum rubrisubalbicans]